MFNADQEIKKWASVLDHKDAPAIKDSHRKAVTAKILENTERALKEERNHITENNQTASSVSNYDPVLISMLRRTQPNLMAYDIASVQPMDKPTGLIFAMKSRHNDNAGDGGKVSTADTEALFDEANTAFSGTGSQEADPAFGDLSDPVDLSTDFTSYGTGVSTAVGEGDFFNDMGFTIEKSIVTAVTRGLKAEYTQELAQDLNAVHGLNAESELATILSTEILAEKNREIVRTVNTKAELGCQGKTTAGIFDLSTDTDGRWSVEKFKNLITEIEFEANTIAKRTRRGKGNFIICSSNVASALAAAGQLDYSPAMSTNLNVDDTGSTFAGVLNGRLKVFIDPYAVTDYVTLGYKGNNSYDAGIFYCPYVPLTMVRATDENTFQPKIGFKTRYGLIANPFSEAQTVKDSIGTNRSNRYYRIFKIDNLNVG
jgi:hypothetical protein